MPYSTHPAWRYYRRSRYYRTPRRYMYWPRYRRAFTARYRQGRYRRRR